MKAGATVDAYRAEALNALAADDWHSAYRWAKGWIGQGGGAWIVDPWLVYAASAIMNGQRRNAVHSIDLALKTWIVEPSERAILRWVRGCIIRQHLEDPKAAAEDFEAAAKDAPAWLRTVADSSREACTREAASSRKRKPSVAPAPDYAGPHSVHATVAPPVERSEPGLRPRVWESVSEKLSLPVV